MANIGVCGGNCDLCPRCNATRSGKTEDLEKLKSLIKAFCQRQYYLDVIHKEKYSQRINQK